MDSINVRIGAPDGIAAVTAAAGTADRQLIFNTRGEFPNIGRTNTLYIATDENRCYYFAPGRNIYVCVGSNTESVKEIVCRLREDNFNG